jgi:hypothetical protein
MFKKKNLKIMFFKRKKMEFKKMIFFFKILIIKKYERRNFDNGEQ